MINSELIKILLSELSEEYFLVDFKSLPNQSIVVLADCKTRNISIEDCSKIAKTIRNNYEELEDWNIKVSSPGLGASFKVKEQYKKNIGKKILIKEFDGSIVKGILNTFSKESINITDRKNKTTEIQINTIKSIKKEVSI